MQNHRMIVVGGGSGIGRGIACAGAAKGAEVVIVGRTRSKLEQTVTLLPAGAVAKAVTADVTSEADVIGLFDTVGEFDHLVSTVAELAYQPVREFDVNVARRAVDSKLISSLLLAKHGCDHARAGGSMTLISGIAAHRPAPGGAMVAAVNGALEALTRALSVELAPLRVNAVSPGWVDTPIWDIVAGENKKSVQASMAARLPVGHIGEPDHIARAVLALMDNDYITGTVLHVDGGHRLV